MFKKLSIVLLCLIMLLTSCASDGGSKTEKVKLSVTDGKADFIFVYPEDADQTVEVALNSLVKYFRQKLSADRISVYDDSRNESSTETEILIGNTNRDASKKALKDLRDREFTVGVYDGRFVIAGIDDQATLDAINHLYMHLDEFIVDSEISSERNYTLRYAYQYDSISIGKTDISAYTIVYPDPGGTYAEKDSAEKYAAQRLCEQISQLCGAILPLENEKNTEAEYKLILKKSDKEDSYSIKTEGKNVVICADSVYSFTKAFDALLENQSIPKDFSAEGNSLLKEDRNEDFVYVSYVDDKVYGDSPVGSIKIGDVDITEYRIIHHDFGRGYSGYGMNEIYAAQQLQKYLKMATGVELVLDTDSSAATEYEILIGNTNRTSEDTTEYGIEEYIIKTEGNSLVITGGEQRGTIYGVYSFLEDYIGCRFFADDCEVIYKADEIIVPSDTNDRYKPSLEYRDIDEYIYRGGEVGAKRKINSSFGRAMSYYQGSSVDFAGSAFVHTMDTVYDLGTQSTQPCFSDEENYQIILEKSRRILKANPNAEIISVTQNDNNNYCTCKDCSLVYQEEESHAGPLIRMVNRLAEELADEYPNIKIETLAYMFSTEVPKVTKPHENVIIQLCSLDMCCAHPLSDLSCETNQRFRDQIEEWSTVTDNLYIWYYAIEFTGNARNAPFMNFDALYDTYTLFMQNNVKGIFNQAYNNEESAEFGALRGYLLSKMMWNTDITKEELDIAAKEFISAYYGEAGDVIEEYFCLMRDLGDDKHFTQYAALSGVIDLNKFGILSDELTLWMDTLADFDYSRTETKNHVNRLRKGFGDMKRYA
ncbi:MAG: DUF4838 domain-containing protein [Clostridia bacterium]|nr:DUF4838 domain-containing protein [Clostridia bacterium]